MTHDHEPAGSPVTAVRRASRGPSAGIALIAVVGIVVAAVVIAIVSGPGPQPVPSAPPVALVTPSPAPLVPSPSSSPAPASAAPIPSPVPEPAITILVLRGVSDPVGDLAALTGCIASARTTGYPIHPAIQGADVDRVAATAGRTSGWLFVPPGIQASTRVWLGDDLADLAIAVGQQVVAVSTKGEVWLGGPSGATRWFPIATPEGLTAWVMGSDEVVGSGRCSPWTVPQKIDGERSLSCTGFGAAACLAEVGQLRLDVADSVLLGGDLVIARASRLCAPGALGCHGQSVIAVATSSGWSLGAGELRAAAAPSATGPFTADPGLMPAELVVHTIARPSLPLPTGGEKASLNSCSETLTGPLRGSPWDPRVAWVGDLRVVWPTGATAFFLRGVTVGPVTATKSTFASEGDVVTLTGMLDGTGMSFDACTVALSQAAGASAPGAVGDVPATTPGPLTGRGTGG